MKISVIIPTLNEAENLKAAVEAVGPLSPRAEVIVSDGGSSDGTSEKVRDMGFELVESSRGRGEQMDRGAERAAGEVLLFLHADTRLPSGWFESVARVMEGDGVVAGGFGLRIDSPRVWFRLIEGLVKLRYRFFGLIYGDQAIFVRKEAFFRVGGFGNLPLMEDVDCVRRLADVGKVVLLDEKVLTSPRRWQENGMFLNTFKNTFFLILYQLGVSPQRLYNWYYRQSLADT